MYVRYPYIRLAQFFLSKSKSAELVNPRIPLSFRLSVSLVSNLVVILPSCIQPQVLRPQQLWKHSSPPQLLSELWGQVLAPSEHGLVCLALWTMHPVITFTHYAMQSCIHTGIPTPTHEQELFLPWHCAYQLKTVQEYVCTTCRSMSSF